MPTDYLGHRKLVMYSGVISMSDSGNTGGLKWYSRREQRVRRREHKGCTLEESQNEGQKRKISHRAIRQTRNCHGYRSKCVKSIK